MQRSCLDHICKPCAMSLVYKLKGELGNRSSYFCTEYVPLCLIEFVHLPNKLLFSRNPDSLSWGPLEANVPFLSFCFIQLSPLEVRIRTVCGTLCPPHPAQSLEHKGSLRSMWETRTKLGVNHKALTAVSTGHSIHLLTLHCAVIFFFEFPVC